MVGRGSGARDAAAGPAAELLPHRVEPVAGPPSPTDAPALAGQRAASPPARSGRATGPRRPTSRAIASGRPGVVLHPAQHRARRASLDRPRARRPADRRAWPRPASRCRCAWLLAWPGRRPAPRAAGRCSARRPGSATRVPGSSPRAVTSRTVKPRRLRCTATDAAAETAVSSDDAMPWPRWAPARLSRNSVAARLPGLLLAAHHQLADARGAAPVHPPQVVAAAVLADRDVLGAAGREGARPVVAGAGPGAAERDRRAAARCAG